MNGSGPMSGLHFAFPDVCLVPSIVPVPTPFPNMALTPTATPSQTKVMVMGGLSHNLSTVVPMSTGNSPGILLGVVSHLVMGPATSAMGSSNVMIGGPPATKMGLPTKQNGLAPNAVGATVSPSQTKVLLQR